MKGSLERRIQQALDAGRDPEQELGALLERDPDPDALRACRELSRLDAALRGLPQPSRSDEQWEALARRIEESLDEPLEELPGVAEPPRLPQDERDAPAAGGLEDLAPGPGASGAYPIEAGESGPATAVRPGARPPRGRSPSGGMGPWAGWALVATGVVGLTGAVALWESLGGAGQTELARAPASAEPAEPGATGPDGPAGESGGSPAPATTEVQLQDLPAQNAVPPPGRTAASEAAPVAEGPAGSKGGSGTAASTMRRKSAEAVEEDGDAAEEHAERPLRPQAERRQRARSASPARASRRSTSARGNLAGARAEQGIREVPAEADVRTATARVAPAVRRCLARHGVESVDVTLIFEGATGRLASASVGAGAGAELRACVIAAVERVRVPEFAEARHEVTHTFGSRAP